MERSQSTRARAVSDARSQHAPGGRESIDEHARTSHDFRSPLRAFTTLSEMPTHDLERETSAMRRRTSAATRRSANLNRIETSGQRSANFTLAGPDQTSQLRTAHENFVAPGYSTLNPAYEQPANVKPVWSLAKPLPRVVRPGMVPTRNEIEERMNNAALPAENSQNAGVDIDPADLEKGKIRPTRDAAQLSAQLKDSRAQREDNFLTTLRRAGTNLTAGSSGQRLAAVASRTSRDTSAGRGRSATLPSNARPPAAILTPPREGESDEEDNEHDVRFDDHNPKLPSRSPLVTAARVQPSRNQDDRAPVRLSADEPKSPMPPLAPIVETAYDTDSVSTLHFEEDPKLMTDMIPLTHADLLDDEIHNNHTSWSVFRTAHREFFAEFLAVFVQISIGLCSDLAVTIAGAKDNNTTDFAWGFATMIAIYISGGISGAHLNPAISTMLWFFRGFPKRKLPQYYAAQFLGAFVACYVAYGCYYSSIQYFLGAPTSAEARAEATTSIVNSFVTGQRYSYIDAVTAFFNEFIGTMFLATTVLALGDDQNAPPGAGMNALIIGFVVVVLDIAFAYQTGAALNPSRDSGVRLAMLSLGYGDELFTNPYWFYGPIVATTTGAFVGATLYDTFIFTGGESPINYPWTRTRRSMHKSHVKWSGRINRLRRSKKSEDAEGWEE